MASYDPYDVWRTFPRPEFMRVRSEVEEALVSLSVNAIPDWPDTVLKRGQPTRVSIRRILAKNALYIYQRQTFEFKVAMSLLALLASDGDMPATAVLMMILAKEIEYWRPDNVPVAPKVLASWVESVGAESIATKVLDISFWEMQGIHPIHPTPEGFDALEEPIAEPSPKAQAPAAASVTVLEQLVDSGGKEDAPFRQKYEPLLRPLPLQKSAMSAEGVSDLLLHEFPWMGTVIEQIRTDLEIAEIGSRKWLRLRPLLMVGPSGVGKSRFFRRLGELTSVPVRTLQAGSMYGNEAIAGLSRAYRSPHPSAPVRFISESLCANPVLFVDEIEKAAVSDVHGSAFDAVLALTEAETASTYFDEYMQSVVNVSHCSWVFAANRLEGLPPAFLDRVRIVHTERPGSEHYPQIKKQITTDILREYGLENFDPLLAPETDSQLRTSFVRHGSLRKLREDMAAAIIASIKKPSAAKIPEPASVVSLSDFRQ